MEGFTMNAKKGHSQSADNSQLLAHKSSPQGGHAFKLKAPYEPTGMLPSYRTMKYKSPIWGYFHVQKE